MVRKLACAVFVLAVSFGIVAADDFGAVITKVDGNKVTFHKMIKGEKGEKGKKGEEMTLSAADAKVMKGKYNKAEKKFEAGDAIETGLKNELFSNEKGVFAHITTSDDNKKITEILVIQKKKKKSDN